ncbi:DUF2968 domain-containing protein [Bordetella genomosp. 12]|uniref:DUF2968 domain-containing protein n=1 Tax=Bordetella genomosp. 12 TaxID=463035 RepID=A0A261VV77_9BORD|nr:DUF2968 domain-containing protein [Bordetella genomosp. 12]OZI77939.1 hypothetical protein CAL22_05305 [Bordetella genomosp. 12]
MKIDILGKGTRLAMAGTILSALAACATTQPQAERPVVQQVEDKDAATTAVTPPPPAAPAAPRVSSTATELQGLIQSRQVSELRTAYNGSYGASLLFKPDDQTYFVVLFQHKDFWRVIKTRNAAQAESTYRAFVARSSELAGIEIKRILLQAEYTQAEQQLAARNAELASLQADQALRQEQEQQVAARQEQSLQETQALTDQNKDVHQQLRALQRQIDTLQAEQMRINNRRK